MTYQFTYYCGECGIHEKWTMQQIADHWEQHHQDDDEDAHTTIRVSSITEHNHP